MEPQSKKTVVLVTGLSGAGISSCLKALEDNGFEAHDNARLSFMEHALMEDGEELFSKPLAFSFDTRMPHFNVTDIIAVYQKLKEDPRLNPHLIFLYADENILMKRFSETRRIHPLATDRPVEDGIKREMDIVMPIRGAADITIDTSDLKGSDLKQQITTLFQDIMTGTLSVTLMSFGFKHGLPRNADTVFDVRFMSNPHYDETLRPQRGTDRAVKDHVKQDSDYESFVERSLNFVAPLLPRYQAEGKSYFTIAIGCTGGHHRSVTVVEDMAARFIASGRKVHVLHRDLNR